MCPQSRPYCCRQASSDRSSIDCGQVSQSSVSQHFCHLYRECANSLSSSLIVHYEFVTSGFCNAGWLSPNVETDSVINCLEICNIRENANHFSWNPTNKACSCYDTDLCSPDTSSYSMEFKSFKMIDNGK